MFLSFYFILLELIGDGIVVDADIFTCGEDGFFTRNLSLCVGDSRHVCTYG